VPPMMMRESARIDWAGAESRRITAEQQPAFQPVADTAASARLAMIKQKEAEATAKSLRAELDQARREAKLIRDIPLVQVLERSGYLRDGGGLWNGRAGRIVISMKGKGGKPRFSNKDTGIGGGGAIDLAMHIHALDFRSAVAWLGSEFGRPEAVGAALSRAKEEAESAVRSPVPVLPDPRRKLVGTAPPKPLADDRNDDDPDIDSAPTEFRNT
jgi:hypothetical protein